MSGEPSFDDWEYVTAVCCSPPGLRKGAVEERMAQFQEMMRQQLESSMHTELEKLLDTSAGPEKEVQRPTHSSSDPLPHPSPLLSTIWVWLRVLVASLDKGLGTHSAYAHRGSVPLRVPPPDARRQSAVTEAFFTQTSPRLNILSVTIVCLWRPPAQLRTGRFFPFSFHWTLSRRFFFFLTKCNMKCYPLKTDRTPRCSFSELCLVTHWGRHTRGVWQRPPTHCKPPAITKGCSELLGGAPIQSLRCGSGAIISLTLVCLMA